MRYRSCRIVFDPSPLPIRAFDWQWHHQDYDGPDDDRCGCAASEEEARTQIDACYAGGEI